MALADREPQLMYCSSIIEHPTKTPPEKSCRDLFA
jgi:hypothetical protein